MRPAIGGRTPRPLNGSVTLSLTAGETTAGSPFLDLLITNNNPRCAAVVRRACPHPAARHGIRPRRDPGKMRVGDRARRVIQELFSAAWKGAA